MAQQMNTQYKNPNSGKHFEKRVLNCLYYSFLDDDKASILYDLSVFTIKKMNPTQIDIVFIYATGIYIIECKCYSGEIAGDEKSAFWKKTYYLADGTDKVKTVHNPISQNHNHIYWLKKFIEEERFYNGKEIPIYSVSVISDKCDCSSINISSDSTYLVHISDFSKLMKELTSKNAMIGKKKIKELTDKLLPISQPLPIKTPFLYS